MASKTHKIDWDALNAKLGAVDSKEEIKDVLAKYLAKNMFNDPAALSPNRIRDTTQRVAKQFHESFKRQAQEFRQKTVKEIAQATRTSFLAYAGKDHADGLAEAVSDALERRLKAVPLVPSNFGFEPKFSPKKGSGQ